MFCAYIDDEKCEKKEKEMKMKMKKSILLIVLLLSSIITALPLASAAPSGVLTISPNKVVSGVTSYIAVSGGSFPAGVPLYYYVGTSTTWPLGAAGTYWYTLPSGGTTIATGKSLSITITTSSYVLVSDSPSGATGSITHGTAITVESTGPTLTSVTASGKVGDTIYIVGQGFTNGGSVRIDWDYPGSVLTTLTAGSDGTIDSSFTVPAAAQGIYRVFALDVTKGLYASIGGVNYAQVTVNSNIVASNSITGVVSSTVTLTGSGLPDTKTISASTIGSPQGNVLIGGVVTYHAQATTSALGAVTISVTGLASALSTRGPVDVTLIFTDGTTITVAGAVIVSEATVRGDEQISLTYSSRYYGQSMPFKLWNFPAGEVVTFTLGSLTLGTATTDASGAASTWASGGTVPAMPSGNYVLYASTATGYVASAQFAVTSRVRLYKGATWGVASRVYSTSYVDYWDTGAAAQTIMWVEVYGLQPSTEYTLTLNVPGVTTFDIVATDGDPGEDNLSPAATTGTFTDNDQIKTNSMGSFLVSFKLTYTSTAFDEANGITPTTGTACTIKAAPSTGDEKTHDFKIVGTPAFDRTWYSAAPAATITGVSLTNLVPLQNYELELDSSVLTLTYGTTLAATSFQADASGASPVMAFAAHGTAGSHTLAIQYQSGALNLKTCDQVSSTAGGVAASSMSANSRRKGQTITFRGWNFAASESISIYMAQTGLITSGATDAYGAFKLTYTIPESIQSGAYRTWIVRSSTTTILEPITQPVTITSYLSRSPTSGVAGESVSVTGYGFKANNPYRIVWKFDATGGAATTVIYEDSNQFVTDSYGKFTGTVKVPTVPASSSSYAYRIYVYEVLGATDTGIYSSFVVNSGAPLTDAPIPKSVPTLTAGSYSLYPLQKTTLTLKSIPLTLTEPVYVTIVIDGAATEMVRGVYSSSAGTIKVTFQMPNGAAGPMKVYCLWTDSAVTAVDSNADNFADYLAETPASGRSPTVVSGNEIIMVRKEGSGALTITGVDLSGDIAYIKTKVDTIKVGLDGLDAKIVSIDNDVATLETNLGTVTAKLTALDAKIVALDGTVATVKTAVGEVKTSVSSIGLKVDSVDGKVVTLSTTLGTIKGTVDKINWNDIATIKTDLGTVTTTITGVGSKVDAAKGATDGLTTMMYVAIGASLVAALAAIFAVMQINKKIA